MQLVPPPNARDLLGPLLACLPSTFVSSRPPPALLPLLSPLLRQRVTYLASDTPSPSGWLPLLAWDAATGNALPEIVEHLDLEPHPVSGELELDELPAPTYRRLDAETLHARLDAEQFGLLPIYVWCAADEHGHTGPGWKLAELRALQDADDNGESWSASMAEANNTGSVSVARKQLAPQNQESNQLSKTSAEEPAEEGDDDDYWAAYDRVAGETPAPDAPEQKKPSATKQQSSQDPESAYFDRYASEVQPALDAHDPDEVPPEEPHASTAIPPYSSALSTTHPSAPYTHDPAISMPRPISPASSASVSSRSLAKLELQAAAMELASTRTPPDSASPSAGSTALDAIKAHISTDLKSLFRLAQTAGLAKEDVRQLVVAELEGLQG